MEAAWALEEMGVKVVSVDVGSSDREEAKARAPSTKAYQIYEGEKEADIYFLIDGSGSINPSDFEDMKTFMNEMVGMFQVGASSVRFGVVQYSDKSRTEFMIGQHNQTTRLTEAIRNIDQIGGGTRTGDALRSMKSLFRMAVRQNVPQTLIVITDGKSQDKVNQAAKELRQQEIVIYAIDVKSAGEKRFVVLTYSFLLYFLVLADLVFLIDGSRSISKSNFSVMKTFMKEIVDSFVISKEKVHVGVVQYSQDPQKEFSLNDFYTNTTIKEQIDSIEQLRSSTFTGKGLRFVRSLFEPANGGRNSQGVSQNLVVITDGHSNDTVEDAALALRSDGIYVFAVGIGIINSFELLRIAGDARKVNKIRECTVLWIKLHASDFLAKVQRLMIMQLGAQNKLQHKT
uniref:VWFA domain-containing protein n=1 Tax=Apteryx owenii TaxID=8824 RepID=A0A8B9QGF4_APTOW